MNSAPLRLLLCLSAATLACSDSTLHAVPEGPPDIDAQPRELRFAPLDLSAVSQTLTIWNLGELDLEISSIVMGIGTSDEFTWAPADSSIDGDNLPNVPAGASLDITVTYDPVDYAPETGELVITTLAKWAQPMIRYRTRDITRLSDAPCPCGRTHRRLLRITGRSDDMLIIRGVNLYPSQVEAVLIGRPNIAPHYQLVVTREGAMDALGVEVEASPGVDAAAHPDIAADVAHQIKSRIGITCRVAVLEPGKIPRSQGKAVRVRDLRPD